MGLERYFSIATLSNTTMSLTATSLAVLALMIPHLVSAAPVAEQALPPLRESFAKRYGYDYGYSPPNPVIIILPIIFGIFIFVAIVSICVRNVSLASQRYS